MVLNQLLGTGFVMQACAMGADLLKDSFSRVLLIGAFLLVAYLLLK